MQKFAGSNYTGPISLRPTDIGNRRLSQNPWPRERESIVFAEVRSGVACLRSQVDRPSVGFGKSQDQTYLSNEDSEHAAMAIVERLAAFGYEIRKKDD